MRTTTVTLPVLSKGMKNDAVKAMQALLGVTKDGSFGGKTDAALRRALSEALPDATVITVAQRVSSVKNCDLILVIEEGVVIGCGTHEYLMETCDEYRQISDSQMGGAFLDE